MNKDVVFTETIFTTLEPKRVLRVADECLIEIRLVESYKESAAWKYEYEVKGDMGKIEKFRVRIHNIEIKK